MPQEFLRDVGRTGDRAGRRQRHGSVVPLSIAGHAVIVTVLLLSPWSTSVELPAIASPLPAPYIKTVAPPPPPSGSPAPTVPRDTGAPIAAPDTIVDERPEPVHDFVEGTLSVGPGVETAQPLLSGLNASGPVTMPPPPPLVEQKPVRPGGVIREPRKILHVAPIYPEIARQARAQGAVLIEAVLDATGRVESIRVLHSEPLLDEAAVRAVRQWRYTPTELNGVPVPVLMTITVRFSLER